MISQNQADMRFKYRSTHLFPQLQKPHHLQGLLDVGDLLAQSLTPPLCVDLHELVFGDHLLEGAEGGFDLCTRRDVVGDIVNEGRDRDAAGVCFTCCCTSDINWKVR